MKYSIKEGYNHRTEYSYFNDLNLTDGWQREVYQMADKIYRENDLKSVADVGCGSGYKLLKHFKEESIIGYDVEPTLGALRRKYPEHIWEESDFTSTPNQADLVICSDVIEHVMEPDKLLEYIIRFSPKYIVLSTPDRDLVYGGDNNGPPRNKTHIREWNFGEFSNFISEFLDIEDHFISNRGQSTQCIVAKL